MCKPELLHPHTHTQNKSNVFNLKNETWSQNTYYHTWKSLFPFNSFPRGKVRRVYSNCQPTLGTKRHGTCWASCSGRAFANFSHARRVSLQTRTTVHREQGDSYPSPSLVMPGGTEKGYPRILSFPTAILDTTSTTQNYSPQSVTSGVLPPTEGGAPCCAITACSQGL